MSKQTAIKQPGLYTFGEHPQGLEVAYSFKNWPRPRVRQNQDPVCQVSDYLLKVASRRSSDSVSILPSVVHLSGFFNLSVGLILKALTELSRHGYQVTLSGLDAPVKLEKVVQNPYLTTSNYLQSHSQEYLTPVRAT